MRHSVATPSYLFRRSVDNLFSIMTSWRQHSIPLESGSANSVVPFATSNPSGWLPLYTMVTFRPDISYSVAKKKSERQAQIVTALGWIGTALVLSMTTWKCLRLVQKLK